MTPRTRIVIWSGAAIGVALLLFTVLNKTWWKNRVLSKWAGSNPYLKEQGPDYWNSYSLLGLIGLYANGLESWEPPGPAPSGTGAFSGTA